MGENFLIEITTIHKDDLGESRAPNSQCEFALRTKLTRLRFAFASQFLKRVRFRFAFAIGIDCEFAEQNLREIHCFQNIFPGFYGLNFKGVLFSN